MQNENLNDSKEKLIGHWEINAEDDSLFWSDEIYKIHGLEVGSPIDLDAAINVYHEDDRDLVAHYVDRALNHKEDYQFILRIVRPNEDVRHVRSTGVVRLNSAGEVRSVFGVFQDITDSIHQERELIEKTKMLEQAEQLAKVGHWAVKVKEGELYWSDEVYRIHGQEPGTEVNIEEAINVYHPEDRDQVSEYVRRAIENKEDYDFQLRIVRSDGEIRNVHSTGVVTVDEHGEVATVFGVFKDITEQIRHEEKLNLALQEADAGNRAKTSFLANMSHELRTPLNSILGFGQMMELNPKEPLTADQKECLNYIKLGGELLLQLIDDVLDLAKIESGKMDFSIAPVSPKDIVKEGVFLLNNLAESQDIRIEHSNLDDVPSFVLGDAKRVQQVFLNLLSNALKYNKKGGIASIKLEEMNSSSLRFSITDDGHGISKENQHLVFEPFNRLGAERTSIEGTGIGLAVSKQFVEGMGGEIGFQSDQGKGSTFWFELPITEQKGETSKEGMNRARSDEVSIPSLKGTLLYVEDSPANMALMEMIVSRIEGLELIMATSAEEGLKIARSEKPDIIIMDINLPGMTGLEALKVLRSDPKHKNVPVFALSAAATEKDISEGIEVGFTDYLTKPMQVSNVMKTIREALPN